MQSGQNWTFDCCAGCLFGFFYQEYEGEWHVPPLRAMILSPCPIWTVPGKKKISELSLAGTNPIIYRNDYVMIMWLCIKMIQNVRK